ncbi:MAG: efflux RND transporter periplasmic adaptor subunit, partial [Myxococcota bacterium]
GLRATLARATADADQRARDAERAERLERTGAAATSTSEAAGAGLETARAAADGASVQLREARRQLGEAVLRAPRDGVITAVFLDPGTVVSAGSPVVAMSAEGGLELRVRAPVHRLASLATDGEVQLERNHGAPCSGRVAQVAQAADGSGLFPIRIDVSECDDGTALVAGESVLALLPQRRERELHVPLRAVIDPAGDSPYLWRNVDGAAERCRVEARGLRGDDRLAVTPLECELSAGDEVVTAGARHLFAGDRLEGAGEGERIIVAEQAQ